MSEKVVIRTKIVEKCPNYKYNDQKRARTQKMKPRDRKLAILRQLGQESEPITLSELVDKLRLDYTNRTVRRWLNELANEGLVQKFGHTKGAKYIASKVQASFQEKVSSCFATESLGAIEKISKPLFERQPVAYNEKWLESYRPNTTFYLSRTLREQLRTAGERANGQDPAGTYAHQVFNRLLIDLSYNSSRLEGNTYSLLDTERLLLHGDSAEGKLDEERIMILNHKEAIRFLVDNAPRLNVSRNVICTLHYLLADGLVEPRYAGKVRDHGVRIGGSTYIPIEGAYRLQQQLEKVAEKADEVKDPFEKSLFMLVHISYLQVFADVNKRTVRLSANIPLITENLVPLAFSDVEVKDYMSAMIAIYELQNVLPIVDLYVYSYMRTCAAYDSTVKALSFDEVRVRYRQERRDVIREIILKKLVGKELKDFIRSETVKKVSGKAMESFIEDVLEDLQQIDESRLVGLGITTDQLDQWLSLNR